MAINSTNDEIIAKIKDENAYFYLCRLEEARTWIAKTINHDIPEVLNLEESLRDGVIIAKIGFSFEPNSFRGTKIFDPIQNYFHKSMGLHFRHTDNINYFFNFLKEIGLPSVFYPETTDIYDRKNMPKLIFCLHALNYYLYRKGRTNLIESIHGTNQFTVEHINAMKKQLELYNIDLPNFSKIAGILADEISEDDAAMHAIIIAINEELLKNNDNDNLVNLMKNPISFLSFIDPENISMYRENLLFDLESKRGKNKNIEVTDDDVYLMYLNKTEIQEKIDFVNHVALMEEINLSIQNDDHKKLFKALNSKILNLDVYEDNIVFYMNFLKESSKDGIIMSLDEVKKAISQANQVSRKLNELAKAVIEINKILETGKNLNIVSKLLQDNFHNVNLENDYCEALCKAKSELSKKSSGNWILVKDSNSVIYYDIKNNTSTAIKPKNYLENESYLSSSNIQSIINNVNSKRARDLFYQDNIKHIITIQSVIRRCLQRKLILQHKTYLFSLLKPALVLQRVIRKTTKKKSFEEYRKLLSMPVEDCNLLNKVILSMITRNSHQKLMQSYHAQLDKIIKIQAIIRGTSIKNNYKLLLSGDHTSLASVQEFIHLLDIKEGDFKDETDLQFLRMESIRMIKTNQELQVKVEQIGNEAGLLIKNQISIMDEHQKKAKIHKITKQMKDEAIANTSIERDTEELINKYSNIFYLFQTCPEYFWTMVNNFRGTKYVNKLRNNILNCFNNGTHKREEYLLIKTLSYILESEIKNMDNMFIKSSDILELIVYILRNIKTPEYDLRNFIKDLLSPVVDNQMLQLKTDPVVIYKQWVFKKEAEEGVSSKLPYNVKANEALDHQNVKELLEESYLKLINITNNILEKITSSYDKIPYGVRYISMFYGKILRKYKFSKEEEECVISAICNLVYFQYVNISIIVPESFGAYVGSVDSIITNDQRFNLAEVGRLIQILATGGDENDVCPFHSIPQLKDFFIRWKVPFRQYLNNICDVKDLNQHFQFDDFMENKLISPPQLYTSAFNLIQLHNMVIEIAPIFDEKKNFTLRDYLQEIGEITPELFLGTKYEYETTTNDHLRKIEFVVTMNNYGVNTVYSEVNSLHKVIFIKCTLMVCHLLRCQKCRNMDELLNTPATEAEEKLSKKFIEQYYKKMSTIQRILSDEEQASSPEEMKKYIKEKTKQLIEEGYIDPNEKYNAYILEISKEIREKRILVNKRKKEIGHLTTALKDLSTKHDFLKDQIDSYNQYIISLLSQNMKKSKNKSNKHIKVNYSGKKMYEKGILLSVTGITEKDYNKLQVTIEEGEEPGSFSMNASFLGVSMKSTKFTLKNLLELQKEGCGHINFDQANCNVNLLIHLINRKFMTN